jgi:hypothetical protein
MPYHLGVWRPWRLPWRPWHPPWCLIAFLIAPTRIARCVRPTPLPHACLHPVARRYPLSISGLSPLFVSGSERASSLVVKGFRVAPPSPGFNPLGGQFLGLVKKTPLVSHPLSGYDVLRATLRLSCCKVDGWRQPVSDGGPEFGDFLGRGHCFGLFLI